MLDHLHSLHLLWILWDIENMAFVSFVKQWVSLSRPYANYICSIFPLHIESNALKKSTNNNVASIFFACEDLMNSQNQKSCGLISLKVVWVFSKNFLNFRSNMVEKIIINLRTYSSKCYALVIHRLPLLGKGRMHPFIYFPLVLCLYTALHNWSKSWNFLVFILQGLFHWVLQLFCF